MKTKKNPNWGVQRDLPKLGKDDNLQKGGPGGVTKNLNGVLQGLGEMKSEHPLNNKN